MVEQFIGPHFPEDLIGDRTVQSPKGFVPISRLDIGQMFKDIRGYPIGSGIQACPISQFLGLFQIPYQCSRVPFAPHKEYAACKSGILVEVLLIVLGGQLRAATFLPQKRGVAALAAQRTP